MDLHVFPIPIPPPTSLSIPSLWVFPVHQPWALISCIQPGLVICFTFDSILVSMLFSQNIPPSLLPQSLKVCSVHLCLFFCFAYRVIFTTVYLSESDCVHIFIDVYVPSIKCAGDRFISMYIHTHVTKPTSLCQTWPVPRRSLMLSVSSSTRGQYYSKLSPRKLILKWLFCAFWFLFSLAVFKILSVLVAGSPFLLHI